MKRIAPAERVRLGNQVVYLYTQRNQSIRQIAEGIAHSYNLVRTLLVERQVTLRPQGKPGRPRRNEA